MRSSPYGLFILVDYPPTRYLQVFLYITKYIKNLYLQKDWRLRFLQFRYYPCCGQENWFQNQSTLDFSVDKRWTPILSISTPILNLVTNLLFQINGHKHTSRSEVTGLRTWVLGLKRSTKTIKPSKKDPSILVLQNCLVSEKNGFVYLNEI